MNEAAESAAGTARAAAERAAAYRRAEYFTRSASTRQSVVFALQPLAWAVDVAALKTHRAVMSIWEAMRRG